MNSELNGKTFLVTGGAGGIGQAVVRAFATEGARVVVHYNHSGRAADRLVDEVTAAGGEALAVQADLTREGDTDQLYKEALGRFGRLDGVVVNAGIWVEEAAPVHRMSLAQWKGTLDADLTSAFLTCRGFLRHVANRSGDDEAGEASIVLVGSTAGLVGEEGHADYSAAKAGMIHGLTLSLKNEIVRLAPRGRVNCVCPGWVATPMAEAALEDASLVARVTATMALRKVAAPEDVAAAVVFLSSARLAGHLSGTILPVAGGMEGRLLHSQKS